MMKFTWMVLYLAISADAARILGVFPMPGKSRFTFNRSLMDALYEAGHNITMIVSSTGGNVNSNYTVIRIPFIENMFSSRLPKPIEQLSSLETLEISAKIVSVVCNMTLNSHMVQDIINSKERKFDVIFTESVSTMSCFTVIGDRTGIPVIGTIAQRSDRTSETSFGNLYNPTVVPHEKFEILPMKSAFLWRFNNLWNFLRDDIFHYSVVARELQELYRTHQKKYGPTVEKGNKFSLLFTNGHSTIIPRAQVQNVIEVGGIHVNPVKPLSQDIKKLLDSSTKGVILFSLGSVVDMIQNFDQKIITAFTNAFAEIPQKVLWKLNGTLKEQSDNVVTMSWFSQNDILGHENVKAFITHCGISGIYEAIYAAKPMIMLPIFMDQFANSATLEKLGVGIHLDKSTITKERLLLALDTVLNGTSYKRNMKKLSRQFKDRPMTPQKSVVYWTEYVIRHNGAVHLHTTATEMTFYQYLLLDVILSMFMIFIVIISISYYVLRRISKCLFLCINCIFIAPIIF